MTQAAGANTQIIFDVETTFGATPGTPNATKFYFATDTLAQKRPLIRSNVLRGNRDLTKPVRGNKDVSGAITTELSPFMGTFLKHLLGVVSTSAGPPYTHTIKVGALPVSLCIEKGFTDIAQYFLYNGCRINRGRFEFNSDGFIPTTFEFMGKKRTASGASFDTTPTDLGHLAFEGFEGSIKEGGSTIAIVTKCEFDISNDLDASRFVLGGAGERNALPEGKCTITGKLTAQFENLTLFTKATAFTESSVEITLTRGTGAGSAGNESLVMTIPEIVYEESDPVISGPTGIVVEMPFSAFYDNASEAASMQMVLKNTQATL